MFRVVKNNELTMRIAFPSPLANAASNNAVLLASDLYFSKEKGCPRSILLSVISG